MREIFCIALWIRCCCCCNCKWSLTGALHSGALSLSHTINGHAFVSLRCVSKNRHKYWSWFLYGHRQIPLPLLLPSLGSFGGFVVAIKHRLSVLLLLPLCCCCLHYNALLLFKNKLCCAWHFFFLFQLSHALLGSGEKRGERENAVFSCVD